MNTTNYRQKNYDTIFTEMLTDAYVEGLLSNDEHFLEYVKNRQDIENSFVMNMSVYALKDAKQYEEMTNIYLANDIDYAVGIDLDTLGQKCNTIRPQATKSSVTLEFSLRRNIPLEYDFTIPNNTIVYTDDGTSYATVDDCTIIRGEYRTSVGALSVTNGGNSRVEPDTLTHCNALGGLVAVTNPQGSSGSHETYTDTEYRELLRNWTYSHIRGTKEAYEEFLASYDGLDDYRLIPRWDGAGTLKIIISPSDDWIINDLYNKLQEKTFLLIEDILITGAVERPIDIDCTINVDIDNVVDYSTVDYSNIRELVEQALKVYVNGGYRRNGEYYTGLAIGQDFVPFKAGIFINEEIPQIMSIDWRDTLNKIDNTVRYDEFGDYNTDPDSRTENVIVENYKLKGQTGQKCKSDILYINYPYLIESDNDGFWIVFKRNDETFDDDGISSVKEVELFRTKQSKFKVENFDIYGGWIELEAYKDNATLSYIRLYSDGGESDYNTHICINNEEKAVLRDCVVKIQGEEKANC